MDGTTPRQRRRSEKEWRGILKRFDGSGLSSREFCKREGLTPSSLQRWRSRWGQTTEPQFVELMQPPTPQAKASANWSLELSLPDGTSVRLRG